MAYELCSNVIKNLFFSSLKSKFHFHVNSIEIIPCTMRLNAAGASYELAIFETDDSSSEYAVSLLNLSQLIIFTTTRSDPRIGLEKLRGYYFNDLSEELKSFFVKIEKTFITSISNSSSGSNQPRPPNIANLLTSVLGRMMHPVSNTPVTPPPPQSASGNKRDEPEPSIPDLD